MSDTLFYASIKPLMGEERSALLQSSIGRRFIAKSVSGEYFLGSGECVEVIGDWRIKLSQDNGSVLDVPIRCCEYEDVEGIIEEVE